MKFFSRVCIIVIQQETKKLVQKIGMWGFGVHSMLYFRGFAIFKCGTMNPKNHAHALSHTHTQINEDVVVQDFNVLGF